MVELGPLVGLALLIAVLVLVAYLLHLFVDSLALPPTVNKVAKILIALVLVIVLLQSIGWGDGLSIGTPDIDTD